MEAGPIDEMLALMHSNPMRSLVSLAPLALLSLGLASCATVERLRSQGTTEWNRSIVEPVSAPVTFESPLIHTSLRPIYARHSFPSNSVFGGGELTVYALQLRVALAERWAFIATKDGYFDLDPDAGGSESGTADIAGGFKYAFFDDRAAGTLTSAGLVYETTSGDEDVLQGNGDGLVRPFVSAAQVLGDWSCVGALGFNWPLDDDEESTSFDWHLQAAWHRPDARFVPAAEINGIHYVSGGTAVAADFEGVDVINLGSSGVAGNDIITGALALRWNALGHSWLGLAYEAPLTSREDVFDDRVTLDLFLF
jgi:hypothetical protein